MLKEEILGEVGRLAFLLGNEAIARGALEGGVQFASAYPGTPSTEVIETLAAVARDLGIHVEWSTNEKVAYEAAVGASMAGLRAMAVMKHVGVNVAADPMMSSAYAGVNGGLVLVVADDPSMHSSQNEQDSRIYGLHAYIPVIEPSDSQECKDYTKTAFELSERYDLPIMVRTSTRVSHARGPVRLGKMVVEKREPSFLRDKNKWAMIPGVARKRRLSLLKRFDRFRREVPDVGLDRYVGEGADLGIVTAGTAYPYVVEALHILDAWDRVTVLKLGVTHPASRQSVLRILKEFKRILVVEELEPFIEGFVKTVASEEGLVREIHGKDLVPVFYELNVERVVTALSKALGVEAPINYEAFAERDQEVGEMLPPRPPVLCPGCPHRATFFALKRAANRERVPRFISSSDIGCYALGFFPPFETADLLYDMGSSIGIGYGLAQSQGEFVVSIIGDSTFFHAGIPALVNAVYNRAPLLVVVLDNQVTAMTGQQPHPGTGVTAVGVPTVPIDIAGVARGVGVEYVVTGDPMDIPRFQELVQGAIRYVKAERKPAVVVAKSPCALYEMRRMRALGIKPKLFGVIPEKCTGCRICVDHFTCPAITMVGDKAWIDPELCVGCGACQYACPYKAIVEVPRE